MKIQNKISEINGSFWLTPFLPLAMDASVIWPIGNPVDVQLFFNSARDELKDYSNDR